MAKTTDSKYYRGVGRRKSAVAQVRLMTGTGQFIINGVNSPPAKRWLRPLIVSGKQEGYDISVVVRGGGFNSQSEAVALGISRALLHMDDSLKSTLRKAGLVTRDPRIKERMKPGLKRARKAPQWSKR